MARMGWREENRARWVGIRPAHEGTQVFGNGETNNATAIIYTVPVGKTFYLTGFHASVSPIAGGFGWLAVFNAAAVRQFDLYAMGSGTAGRGFGVAVGLTFPLELAAGESLRIFSSAGNFYVHGAVWGWLE